MLDRLLFDEPAAAVAVSGRTSARVATAPLTASTVSGPTGQRRILCAHADRNGVGAHWKTEGEPCPGTTPARR